MALGAWELFCFGRTLLPLVGRRQRRARYRTPVRMRARIEGTTVRVDVVDLTPDGAAVEVPHPMLAGTTFALLSRIPDARGKLHGVRLPVEVRSCATSGEGAARVGCRFVDLDVDTRERLVEFAEVVLPRQGLAHRRWRRRPVPAVASRAPERRAG
jgi:hypothetical protein